MADVKYVLFCMQTKQEVEPENMDAYLEANPDHHLVECVRGANPVNNVVPVVESLVAPDEQVALDEVTNIVVNEAEPTAIFASPEQIVTIINENGGGGDSYSVISFAENNVARDDWCQIGTSTDAYTSHVIPFNCEIVGIAISYRKIKLESQSIKIYLGPSTGLNDHVHETPAYVQTYSVGSKVETGLSIPVGKGTAIRVRGGQYSGYFEKVVINLMIKKV